jgi:hypothetical protein
MTGVGEQIPLASAVDKGGNVVIAGVFEGTAEVGGGQLQSLGGIDAFVVKYKPDGSGVVFSLSFSGLEDQEARAVAVDKAGNTIVVGSFAGSIHFGGPSAPLMSAGMNDIFVAKISPSGSVLWKQQFGDMNDQRAAGVAVDSTGNIYVAGRFEGTLTWGGTMLASAGDTDAFIAKLSPEGDPAWSYRSGDASAQGAEAVAVDNGDNVLLTGWFKSSIDLGGTKAAAATDGFLAKLNSAGSLAWSKQIGGIGDARPSAIAVDTSGDVIVAGHFTDLINIESKGEEPITSGEDSFLLKYTKAGEYSWHILINSGFNERIWSLAADSANNILMSGFITDTTSFNDVPVSYTQGKDAFLGKLDPSGVPIWLKAAGDAADQQGTSVAVAPNDDVLWAGQFKSKISLGNSSFTSSDANDAFVARILE